MAIPPMSHWNLRIKSDGTPGNTEVHVGDTKLEGVTGVTWRMLPPDHIPEAIITVYPGSLDVAIPIEEKK